jgi:Xaa-Pro aminopeptidase
LFYIPGELGIRHEDTVGVTADVCGNLAPKVVGKT